MFAPGVLYKCGSLASKKSMHSSEFERWVDYKLLLAASSLTVHIETNGCFARVDEPGTRRQGRMASAVNG